MKKSVVLKRYLPPKYIREIGMGILLAMLLLPYFMTILYVVPSADDFANGLNVLRSIQAEGNRYSAIHKITIDSYMGWQGTWSSIYLLSFLLSVTQVNFGAIRLILLLNALLFFFSLWYAIRELCGAFVDGKRSGIRTLMLAGVILTGLSITTPKENLYWLTGACVYTIPFSFALLGACHYARYFQRSTKRDAVICTILGVFAAGGVLQVAAIVNFLYLLIVWLDLKTRGMRIKRIIPFFAVLISALVNTLAPGNYERHQAFATESTLIQLFNAFVNTGKILFERISALMAESYLAGILICLVLVIFCSKKTFRHLSINPCWCWAAAMIGTYLSGFPVALGFNRATITIRVAFLLDVTIALFVVSCTAYTAIWIRQKWHTYIRLSPSICFVPALILAMNMVFVPMNSMIFYIMPSELLDGTMLRNRQDQLGIIEQIATSESSDVIIIQPLTQSFILKNIGLTSDETHWVNIAVADFFGKKTVRFIEWRE